MPLGCPQVKAILELPVLVVLDEAYIEFAGIPSKINWVETYPNLVVLRTFSKCAGACAPLQRELGHEGTVACSCACAPRCACEEHSFGNHAR